MTEEREKYDTDPKDLNELKERFEATGGDWKDALEKIKKATKGKDIADAMKEGWTVADFAKALLDGNGEGETTESPSQNLAEEATGFGFTEAPASINFRFDWKGWNNIQLTIRDKRVSSVLKKMETAIGRLEKMGAQPTGRRGGGSGGNGAGSSEHPDTKICPLHHVAMRKREKDGQVWYSHKAVNPDTNEEYWCKGTAK